MVLELDRIKTHMEIFEGRAAHMYLDALGRVSVGVSHRLPDLASAQALPFIDRATGDPATLPQIAADFEAIQNQPKGQLPYLYGTQTSLDLPESEVDILFQQRIQVLEQELRDCYPSYDTFPNSAKLALLDMTFSLDAHALQAKWPRLNTAISLADWHTAALECERPEALRLRNENTRALFEIARSEPASSQRSL